MRRRAVLEAVGAAGVASVAGCSALLRSEETLVDDEYAFNAPETWQVEASAGDLLSVTRGTTADGFYNQGAAAFALYRRDSASRVTLLAAWPGDLGTYDDDGWLHVEVPESGTYEYHLLHSYRHARDGTGTFEGVGEPDEQGRLVVERTTHHGRSGLDEPYVGSVTDAVFWLMDYEGMLHLWPQKQTADGRHTVYSDARMFATISATTHPLLVRWLEYLGNEWLVPAGSDRLREAERIYRDAIPYVHSNAAVVAAERLAGDLQDEIHRYVAELIVRNAGVQQDVAVRKVVRYLDEHASLSFDFAAVQQSDRSDGRVRNVVRLTADRTFTIDWSKEVGLSQYPNIEVDLEFPIVFPVDTAFVGPLVRVEDITHSIATTALRLFATVIE